MQRRLQDTTRENTGWAVVMQIGDDQAVLMEIIARAMGAPRAVEVGTFTGYSALAVARMGPEGHLLCCDVSEEWTAMARRRGRRRRSPIASTSIGPGIDTLRALPPDEQFDLAFIDADKTGYPEYYEEILQRLRPGGLILLDNMLQGGVLTRRATTRASPRSAISTTPSCATSGCAPCSADRRRRQRGAEAVAARRAVCAQR